LKILRIFLIEDDPAMGVLLTMTLEGMGHEVCGMEQTANAAISGAISAQPDLIIADVNLTEGNGIDALDQICLSGFVPHIFASGDIRMVTELKPDAIILQKPFTYGQMVAAIERATQA
jgi:DNA-binding NtrC family response regulator